LGQRVEMFAQLEATVRVVHPLQSLLVATVCVCLFRPGAHGRDDIRAFSASSRFWAVIGKMYVSKACSSYRGLHYELLNLPDPGTGL
jgi:hypothetical protein